MTGDFERAVRESTRILKVRGRVLPATLEDVVLHAELQGGERVAGESTITAADRLPRRVWLEPEQAARRCHRRSRRSPTADLVVLGPGSVFTSVVPNLLIPEMREAVRRSAARVVYVCNVMTQPGETDGFSAADHLSALYRHGAAGLVDDVVVNDTPASAASWPPTGAWAPSRSSRRRRARCAGRARRARRVAAGGDASVTTPSAWPALLMRLAPLETSDDVHPGGQA